jgi:hypothetical protein
LKARYLWYASAIIVFLMAALWIDESELIPKRALETIKPSLSLSEGAITLRACDPIQRSFLGPLIPDQNITQTKGNLSDINPDEILPQSAWSTRAGFSISTPTAPEYWAQLLGSGWYVDWRVNVEPIPDNLDYWPMIRVHEDCIFPSWEEIQSATARLRGHVWIIGNEPDVIWQDNVSPTKYAAIYHQLYQLIKSSDPTAMIAVGGVSQATALRLQYLDQVLQTYQNLYHEPMPVDWWTVHGYVLREEKDSWGVDIPPGIGATQGELREVMDHGRIDLFEDQIRSFRMWMADNGYQHTPLAITEFGILMPSSYGFPAEFVAGYLEQSFSWLSTVKDQSIGYPKDGYHLVQKWAWFSISDPTYSTSDLGDLASGKLTLTGESFRKIVQTMAP